MCPENAARAEILALRVQREIPEILLRLGLQGLTLPKPVLKARLEPSPEIRGRKVPSVCPALPVSMNHHLPARPEVLEAPALPEVQALKALLVLPARMARPEIPEIPVQKPPFWHCKTVATSG
jgi:hypothetical protein